MQIRAAFVVLVLALAACTRPMEVVIPSDMSKWDKDLAPAIKKLGAEDQKLVQGYLMRMKMSEALSGLLPGASAKGEGIPLGTTVGQAIAAQRLWMAEEEKRAEAERAKAAEERALKERLAQEAAAALAELQNAVTVVLVSKGKMPSNPRAGQFSDKQTFVIGVTNKTHKKITGVSGTLEILDLFEKEVGGVSFRMMETIEPGSDARWHGERDYNQFIPAHKRVWDIEEGRYSTRFIPDAILFADGSKLSAKQGN